jgi:heterotetrameric sarcosine oxidase gamma subunit
VSAGAPLRRTALYRAQVALGARFRAEAAWEIADVYTSPEEEAQAARLGVGLVDASAGAKLGVRGEDSGAVVEKITGQAAPRAGRAVRARVDGAEVVVCPLAPDEILVLAHARDQAGVAGLLAGACEAARCAHVTDLTSAFAALDLVGPRTLALLEKLVPLDLSPAAAPPLAVVPGELAGVRVILVRLDHPPLAAFRALVPRECGAFVWEALREAGRDLGLTPVGAAAYARLLEGR